MMTLEQKAEWDVWVESRPPVVRELAKRFPPTRAYLLSPTTQIVHIVSYNENGTLTVGVIPEENEHLICALPTPYEVFGIKPENLSEPS